MSPRRSAVTAIILSCFFLSGMTGLTYEILWTRLIVRIIGAAPFAISIVLTIFMGGLGLGSYLASKYVDRIKEPDRIIRLYGLLEIAIGLIALILPIMIDIFGSTFGVIYNNLFEQFAVYSLVTFLGCALILGVPVICMGATLPVLIRFYITSMSHVGTNAGRLYGLNTLGAALGSLLCGFWMVQHLGMWGSLTAAVAANLAIGMVCLLISRRPLSFAVEKGPEVESLSMKTHERTCSRGVTNAALILFAVSGFCSMAYEVIWAKLLGLIVGPTTYSFTIVLVTFITGLAIGAMVFGKLADRTERPVQLLLLTQVAAALLALVASQLMGNSQLFYAKLIFRFQENFTYLSLMKAGTLFVFMFLPTMCLGATFPLVGKIFTRSADRAGRSIGLAYAINTVGAVLGSFAAGFILIPSLGKENSLSLVVAVQLLGAAGFAAVSVFRAQPRLGLQATIGAAAILALVPAVRYPTFNQLLLSTGKYFRFEQLGLDLAKIGWLESLIDGSQILSEKETGELVFHGDGIGGVTTVMKYSDVLGNPEYSMVNSGKPDASSRGDMQTQTMSAHFPMLYHPGAKSVMVIGLASGVTAGEVLHYPVDSLDVIEISPEVVEASQYFTQWNNNVLKDDRTELIVQDARAHLMLTDRTYDVIISEPSNPWMAGLATLFTREFFAYAQEHLREHGMFVQFIHSYQMDWFTFALVGRTFVDVFPNSMIVSADPSGFGSDYLLIGFKDETELDLETAERNLAFAQKSGNVTITDSRLPLRMVVAENLREVFGVGPINTDTRPRLEYNAPKLMYASDSRIFSMLASRGKLSEPLAHHAAAVRDDVDLSIEYARFALSVYEPFRNMVNLKQADSAQTKTFLSLLGEYCGSYGVDVTLLGEGPDVDHCRDCQIQALQVRADSVPDRALAYSYLAQLQTKSGRPEGAAEAYRRWLAYDSTAMEAYVGLGVIMAGQGEVTAAEEIFDKALAIDPSSAVAYHNRGMARVQAGKFEEAEFDFVRAIELQPNFAEARCNLGLVCLELGQQERAVRELQEALRLRPDFPVARRGLAQALALRGVK